VVFAFLRRRSLSGDELGKGSTSFRVRLACYRRSCVPGQRCTTTGRAIRCGVVRWSSHEFISWLLSRTTSYRAGVVHPRGFEDSIRTTIVLILVLGAKRASCDVCPGGVRHRWQKVASSFSIRRPWSDERAVRRQAFFAGNACVDVVVVGFNPILERLTPRTSPNLFDGCGFSSPPGSLPAGKSPFLIHW